MVSMPPSKSGSPGRRRLPPEFVAEHKRERAALAVGTVVREFGVGGLTVALITERAKMARNTFYELFGGREEALEFGVELGSSKLRDAVDRALGREGDWEDRVQASIGALLEAVEAAPALSELALVHRCGAHRTPGAVYDPALVEALAAVLRAGRQQSPPPGPGPRTEELLAYGILSVIATRLLNGEAGSLRALCPELTELAILPFRARKPVALRSA